MVNIDQPFGLALTPDIHQAAQLIMASCGEDTASSHFQAKACQLAAANADTLQKNTPAIKSRKTGFTVGRLPFAPKWDAFQNGVRPWRDALKEIARDQRSSGVAKRPNLCRYCKAAYVPGHTCQEYRDAKKKQYAANRAARVVVEDPDDIYL